jgi:hypothetical protein
MPDRSSRHGLSDEWSHGSHARRQYSVNGASDGLGAAETEAIPAKTDAYSPADADPFATPPGGYRAATADPFGGASTAGAEPFGARNTDPFGRAATGAFGTASFGTASFGTEAHGAGAALGAGGRGAGGLGAGGLGAGGFGAGGLGAGGLGAGGLSAVGLGVGAAEAGTARPERESATALGDPVPAHAADARSFLRALFDFGFTSFVTPKVIKALYVLIAIGTAVSALVFTIYAFRASTAFGVVTLVFADPLFILIVLAIYRIALEFFMVTFRVAEDIRALRERGDLR